jgi:hypothetical protein
LFPQLAVVVAHRTQVATALLEVLVVARRKTVTPVLVRQGKAILAVLLLVWAGVAVVAEVVLEQ